MIENPFKYTGPLDLDEDSLITVRRTNILNRIVEGLGKGEYWVILGPKQIGKTTFLRQVARQYGKDVSVLIDFTLVPKKEDEFYRWLTKAVLERIPWQSLGENLINKTDCGLKFYDMLSDIAREIKENRILFLFDEVDHLPFARDFLFLWRKIFHDRGYKSVLMKYLVVMTSSQNPVSLTAGRGSPFNIAWVMHLKDFGVEESRDWVEKVFQGLSLRITKAAVEKLVGEVGGHPQMLQQACHYLVEMARTGEREIDVNDIDSVGEYMLVYSTTLDLLRSDIEREEGLYNLIGELLRGEKRKFFQYSHYALFGAGAIKEENGYCRIRNRVYEGFLRGLLDISRGDRVRVKKADEGLWVRKEKAIKVSGGVTTGVEVKEVERGGKKIPYGVSSFESMRKDHYYYIDKTAYLSMLEFAGRFLFFIRPRRFGKSLFLSMLGAYYDIARADQFADYFAGTFVYNNPTEERGCYLILHFDFSGIASSLEGLKESFLNHVKNVVNVFLRKYEGQLKIDAQGEIEKFEVHENPSDIMERLLGVCRNGGSKVYVIIDEYDNFANTIWSAAGSAEYERITHGDSFFRDFFKSVKKGTNDNTITRLFMTGVSPITLDDITSGFNIGLNISVWDSFQDMLGFREEDVIGMIEYYGGIGKVFHETFFLMEMMGRWYNHYCFSEKVGKGIYNPTLVLYFMNRYLQDKNIPKNLIDSNVKIEYSKLKHLLLVDRQSTWKSNGNFLKLKTVIEDGYINSHIEESFPLRVLGETGNFCSLLFYFGLLTIKGPGEGGKLRLEIPNESVKRLFYDYIKETYWEMGVFRLDLDKYANLMNDMAFRGQWKPLLDFLTGEMAKSTSLRDYIGGEKSIQAFLNVYLGLSDLYLVYPEKELNKGYADIILEPHLERFPGIEYAYLIELKYINAGKVGDGDFLQKKIKEAEDQVRRYCKEGRLLKTLGKRKLIGLVGVFSSHEALYTGAVDIGKGSL